jgi:methylated-DNA-[protein]-cysteine S-methyltransferase
MKNAFTIFRVKPGWMGLVGDERGIQRIYLPGLEKEDLRKRIQSEFPGCQEKAAFLEEAEKELKEYFEGRRSHFGMVLDLSRITPFQKKVYQVMSSIPFGEVRTYGWLAQRIGNPRALRAVGSANARNRWPLVIPCHRVVGSDGRLTGFSAPGGLDLKASLLKLEGIPTEQGKVQVANCEAQGVRNEAKRKKQRSES